MASLEEYVGTQRPQLGAAVEAGWETLSQWGEITFTKYVRLVLPLDGFVFWVRADILSKSALLNAAALNTVPFNAPARVVTPASTLTVLASVHHATDLLQEETKTRTTNRVVVTTKQEIQDFNQIGPNVLFLCTLGEIQFAFSSRGYFYEQAQTWHYAGNAVYSDMASQIIDSPAGFDTANVVVSNSLPLWLALNSYVPVYPAQPVYPTLTLWPSFLAPQNEPPPYATVHVVPESTRALTAAAAHGRTMSHYQPARETVRVTLKGLRNFSAQDFIDFVTRYTLDYGTFGFANMPIVRDEKQGQVELTALSMTKTIDFDINYTQTRRNDLVRQLILKAVVKVFPGPA